METILFDGKARAREIEERLAKEIANLRGKPIVRDFGDLSNPEVRAYVNSRRKHGDHMGVSVEVFDVASMSSAEEFYRELQTASEDPHVTAIWVDQPLPFDIDEDRFFQVLSAAKDGEGIHPENLGRLLRGEEDIVPATARAVIEALDSVGFNYEGATAVVVGRSLIVGRPTALLLLHRHCTVTICHSRTKNLSEHTRRADLLVVALGKPGFVDHTMIRENAFVVDVGTNFVDGKLVGDVNPEGLPRKVAWMTPVPGGIGPLTSVLAFENILRICQKESRR